MHKNCFGNRRRVRAHCVRLAVVINYGLATPLFTCILIYTIHVFAFYFVFYLYIYSGSATAAAKPLADFSLLFKFAVARLWLGTLKGLERVAKFSEIIKTLLVNTLYDKQCIHFEDSHPLFAVCPNNGI